MNRIDRFEKLKQVSEQGEWRLKTDLTGAYVEVKLHPKTQENFTQGLPPLTRQEIGDIPTSHSPNIVQ